ncbi:hypothetical protein [Streptomyces sp. NPDC058486]
MHGIGQQLKGATLLSWAEPLLEVLTAAGGAHGLRTQVTAA